MIKMVLFDLDDTIVDSNCFEEDRNNKNWANLDEKLVNFKILFDADQVILKLKEIGIRVGIITTSPKNIYALRVLKHFDIELCIDDIYGYEYLIANQKSYYPLKASAICEIMEKYALSSDEILFVGDSEQDFKACESTNIIFMSHLDSTATKLFNNKLITINDSYNEIIDIIGDINFDGGCIIYKRTNCLIGSFYSLSNYIKDVYVESATSSNPYKITYDSMHSRILELKSSSEKSAINWLSLLKKINLNDYFSNIDYVVRVFGSEECEYNIDEVKTLDLLCYYIAQQIGAEYKPNILSKSSPNEKLHKGNKNKAERQQIMHEKYDSCEIENKSILVIDDIITTGSSMSEIKRAIMLKNPSSSVKFLAFAETVEYSQKSYLENIVNCRHFVCASKLFKNTKHYNSVLAAYLYKFSLIEMQSVYSKGRYLTFIIDTKDKKILNRKSNYFYYFSLVINSVHGYIEEDRTVMDTFNILEESRIYNHRTTLDFIKNIMQDLLRKFN